MKTIFLYLCLGIMTICACSESAPVSNTEEQPVPTKKFNNDKVFEPIVLNGENGQQFIFRGFEVTDQNAGAVAGIRVHLDFDFIHNGLAEKNLKRLLKFFLSIESNGQEIYNSNTNPPTEKQDYYYHDDQSELIKSYRSSQEGITDTIHFWQSVFIPYFRIDAPAGKLAATINLNLKNKKQAAKWEKLPSVTATFAAKPKRVEATFVLAVLDLNPLKKYDPNIGFSFAHYPDIQWFIRNHGYVFYSSEVKKDNCSGPTGKISFAFSEGDLLELEVVDFDKGPGNANDRIGTIDLPYEKGDLKVNDFSEGDIDKLSYTLTIAK